MDFVFIYNWRDMQPDESETPYGNNFDCNFKPPMKCNSVQIEAN